MRWLSLIPALVLIAAQAQALLGPFVEFGGQIDDLDGTPPRLRSPNLAGDAP